MSKYPTLKLFRHGQVVKREYRGQRSAEALSNYVKDMLKSTIIDVTDSDDLDNLDVSSWILLFDLYNVSIILLVYIFEKVKALTKAVNVCTARLANTQNLQNNLDNCAIISRSI